MAWPEQLPSGYWRACWRDQAGTNRSTVYDPDTGEKMRRKEHAKRVAGKMEDEARKGRGRNVGQFPSWTDWRPLWLEVRRVEPSTAAGDTLRIDKYLEPKWGGWRLNRIRPSDVQAWVNDLAATDLAAGSIEKIVRLFSASLTAAVESERVALATNPCSRVKMPRIAPGHERFLTRDEIDRIVYHLDEPYRTAVLIAVWTGLRWGELAGLHWQRIDGRVLDVVETWDREAQRVKTYPKGHNRRGVPIGDRLLPVLEAAREWDTAAGRSCGLEHAKGGAKCRSSLVVPAPRGGAINGQNFGRRQWSLACDLAGVSGARLHDLRHTFASWLVQDGVPLQEVQRLLGHVSINTTQRYSHLGVSQQERVLAALR